MAKYINSPETTVYHKGQMFYGLNWSKDYIRQADNAFIVEGEFDLISPFQAGFKNIVALKGTAFTESQLTLLKRYCQNITLMLDSDFAGLNATRKSILLADSLGFNINAVDLGSAKDPDLAVRSDPTLFKKQVKQAVSIWDFIITSSSRTYDASTDIGKKNILNFTFPFLTQIDNQVIKSSYLSKLASLLDVDPQSIFAEASRFVSAPSTTQSTNIHLPTSSTDSVMLLTQKLQLSLLIHLFSQDQPRHFLKEVASYLDVISLPSYQKIINILQAFRLKTFSPSKFIHKLPPELVELFEQIYIQSQDLSLDHIQTTKKVISLSHQIKTIDLKQQQKQLSLQIAQAEKLHQLKQAKKLQIKYNHILNQIGKIQSKI